MTVLIALTCWHVGDFCSDLTLDTHITESSSQQTTRKGQILVWKEEQQGSSKCKTTSYIVPDHEDLEGVVLVSAWVVFK